MKRLFDFIVSSIALLVLSPLLAVLMIAVRCNSSGSSIFSQPRIGAAGRVFLCRKLRTMHLSAPNLPTHEIDSSNITSIGNILRRTKLDELPQLWNVVLGEMSLVGPRPCLPSQTLLIEERGARGVLSLRPGITGLAQVRGIDMSDPVRLARVDAEYLLTQSFFLDLRLIAMTIFSRSSN